MVANSSFNEPVELPASGPDVGPFVCPHIPVVWLPYVLGALSQLRMPVAWKVTTEAQVADIMGQVDVFIGSVAVATMCDERGTVSITIAIGAAAGTATVTFPTAFTTTPVVVCSCDNGDLTASWVGVLTTGFTAVLTSATPVVVAVTATFSWSAGPAT